MGEEHPLPSPPRPVEGHLTPKPPSGAGSVEKVKSMDVDPVPSPISAPKPSWFTPIRSSFLVCINVFLYICGYILGSWLFQEIWCKEWKKFRVLGGIFTTWVTRNLSVIFFLLNRVSGKIGLHIYLSPGKCVWKCLYHLCIYDSYDSPRTLKEIYVREC